MVFGLFKEKLNINDHKHVINYIISEEANQQWAYHVLENDFKKEAFRGLPFAKNVLNSFVTMNLNMKVSDEILSSIADLGYRKCREWLDTYNSLNKKISKMKFNDLVKSSGPIFYYAEIMPERYPDFAFNPNAFKGLNNTQLNIYFGKRNQNYNIVMYVQREMNCYVKNMIKRKEYQKLNRIEQDHLLDIELEKIKKMKKKQQNELIEKLEDKAEKDFEKRNKFNEVGHQIKMFKWLKDKVNKKMNNEMHNCITQNLNFVYMVEARKYALKDDINEEVMSHVYMIKDESENIKKSKNEGDDFTNDESDILLKLNMDCRKLWANYFGGSDMKFDKEFPIDKSIIGDSDIP